MGYSFRLAARVVLYASAQRCDNTYHGLCYSSCGALAGMRNSSIGPPWRIDPRTHCTMSEHFYYGATSHSCFLFSSCYWHNNVHHFQAIIMHYYFNTRSEVDPGQGCIHSTYHLYVSHSNHWTTELVIQVQSSMQLLMRDYPIQNHHSLNTDVHFLSSPLPPVLVYHITLQRFLSPGAVTFSQQTLIQTAVERQFTDCRTTTARFLRKQRLHFCLYK